jgi:NitT/TauT family transport system ATP-binding protein
MQQRVALARALAYQPDCLVMDEPFASVDAQTRFDLEDLVLRLRAQFGITVLFVTHDIDEAVYLSDRVVVLTGSPARVSAVLDIALDSPRDQIATKRDPRFAEWRTTLFELIRRPPDPGRS